MKYYYAVEESATSLQITEEEPGAPTKNTKEGNHYKDYVFLETSATKKGSTKRESHSQVGTKAQPMKLH